MSMESEMKERVSSHLIAALNGNIKGRYLLAIVRTNMGLHALENLMREIIEANGIDIERVERVWSGAATMGAIGFRLQCDCGIEAVVLIYHLCDSNILLSITVQNNDPLTEMYDEVTDNVSSSVFRVFTEKLN